MSLTKRYIYSNTTKPVKCVRIRRKYMEWTNTGMQLTVYLRK